MMGSSGFGLPTSNHLHFLWPWITNFTFPALGYILVVMNWKFVSPQIHTLWPWPTSWLYLERGAVRRLTEVIRLRSWSDSVSALMRRGRHTRVFPLYPARTTWQVSLCKPDVGFHQNWICQYLGLGLPSFQDHEKCLLFKPLVYGSLLPRPEMTKMTVK